MNCKCRCGCPIWVSKKSGQLICRACEGGTVFGKPVEPKHTWDIEQKDSIQAWKDSKSYQEEDQEEPVSRRWNNGPPRGWMNARQLEKATANSNADELRRRLVG